MLSTLDPLATELEAQLVIARAADAGFRLASHETDAGQVVWEWRRGSEPRPQFVTRRVAVHWMGEFLEREGAVAFVSDLGQSIA
jgi:hypothetical protein